MDVIIEQKIKAHIREFFTDATTLHKAQRKLCNVRNIQIAHYTQQQSRQIWMALIIYKFKKEMDANEAIYNASRGVVLGLLRSDDNLGEKIEDYFMEFKKYKESDYTNFVAEIASFYYNIIQIKQSIEKTEHEVTKNEWEPQYTKLINDIRLKCNKLGCLEAIDGFIQTMEIKKYDAVSSVMERVFWDKVYENINNNQYEILYANLEELRNYMLDIEDSDEIKEEIDIPYIRQRIENNVAEADYWINLYLFILDFLEKNDASHFSQRYGLAKTETSSLANKPINELIVFILEKSFFFVVDLKSRIGIWRNLLKEKTK